MKTAISVPDDIFERADEFAGRARLSRSEVYSRALREYLARHGPDTVTESLNAVVAAVEGSEAAFRRQAARRVLERSEW